MKIAGGRFAVVAALAALVCLLGLNEVVRRGERAGPGEETVDRDVAPARARLAETLSSMERRCADAAATALSRTADVTDQNVLLATLSDVKLPEGAGLSLEDANRRVIAWSGATIDDSAFAAMPRQGDGAWLVDTPASRRLAVRRTRASPRSVDGAPFLAVCHVRFAENLPLRNRALTPSSLEKDVASSFRVDEEVRVLPPDAFDGEPLTSSFGGTLAKLDVRPLSAESWNEAVDAAARRRGAAILAALVVVLAVAMWRETTRLPRRAGLARSGVVLAARAALALVASSTTAGLGPLTDVSRYSHPLAFDVSGTALSLFLTCVAVCIAARCLYVAARDGPARPGPLWRTLLIAVAVAAACQFGLAHLVEDVVENSTVEFFAPESILPGAAAATLCASLLAAGVAATFLVRAAWAAAPPTAAALSTARAIAAALVLAAVLAPLPPQAPHTLALGIVAVVGFWAALAACLVDAGPALRAAAVPLGAAVALFAPLEGRLHLATQRAVQLEAAERVSRTVAAERIFVRDTLDGAARDQRLLDALRAKRLPRDLALSLWAKCPLARRSGGSSLEIVPLAGFGERQSFSADLPPGEWLPREALDPDPGGISEVALPGRPGSPGAEGRWIVGDTAVEIDGRPAAHLHVVLEVRPPATTLPELRVLGTSRAPDSREAPPLSVTRYAPDGGLLETDDPYRPAGERLDAELRRVVVEERRESWRTLSLSDRELEVYVRPDVLDDEVVAVHAFSYNTGGTSELLLRGTRAALCGALVSLAALLLTARSWAGGARLRLAQRLVVSYALVAALPLTVLGWANREIALQRAIDSTRRDLMEAMWRLSSALHNHQKLRDPADLPPAPERLEDLRTVAYAIGHHANVFLGPRLVATSDQGLFDTELLPTRMPGHVYRDVIRLGQPYKHTKVSVGGYIFDVGYAPWRSASEDKVLGAVSVPLLHQRRLRDRELASATTAVLGLYLASLVAAVAVGTWLARRMTKPLSDLTDASKRVARGDLQRPVAGAGPDELGEVVSAFNQMQRDLGESRARLVKAEKEAAWRDMARQVAHEVKNPLTPMRLAAEHLRRAWRDKAPKFDEVLERSVDLIVRQTESLQRIATAFSDFARFPQRRREPVDVAGLVNEVLDLWRASPDLEIRREIALGLPLLSADPDESRRVVVNLVKNSIEAMEGTKGVLTASLVQSGAHVVLTVADDGPGIPDDVKPRLFEPYLSTKTKGTGLGLAICKRAVEDLGGTIGIESRQGVGTTVTVRLPLGETPTEPR